MNPLLDHLQPYTFEKLGDLLAGVRPPALAAWFRRRFHLARLDPATEVLPVNGPPPSVPGAAGPGDAPHLKP